MTEQEKTYYCLMDGRANFSIDKATVLETCDTIDEAMNSIDNYGADTCLIRVSNGNEEILFSLLDDKVECFCSPVDTNYHEKWCPMVNEYK